MSSDVFGMSDYGEDFARLQGSSNKVAEGAKFHSIKTSNGLVFHVKGSFTHFLEFRIVRNPIFTVSSQCGCLFFQTNSRHGLISEFLPRFECVMSFRQSFPERRVQVCGIMFRVFMSMYRRALHLSPQSAVGKIL